MALKIRTEKTAAEVLKKNNPVNPIRLKRLLTMIVERLVQHEHDCFLNLDMLGRQGLVCTCGANDAHKWLKTEIDRVCDINELEEEHSLIDFDDKDCR